MKGIEHYVAVVDIGSQITELQHVSWNESFVWEETRIHEACLISQNAFNEGSFAQSCALRAHYLRYDAKAFFSWFNLVDENEL